MPDLAAQVACVKREIAQRERVYPRWIAAGRLSKQSRNRWTQERADRELATMRAALATLEALADRDLLGKALLLVSRAERRMRDRRYALELLSYDAIEEWPPLEPPAEADRIFKDFSSQDEGGRNIVENWRRQADATIAAIFARIETPLLPEPSDA